MVVTSPVVKKSSWLLKIANTSGKDLQTAQRYCEKTFEGNIRTYPNDGTMLTKRGNITVWNGYHFNTPWLENVGRFVYLFYILNNEMYIHVI